MLEVEVKVLKTKHGGEWLTNRPIKSIGTGLLASTGQWYSKGGICVEGR